MTNPPIFKTSLFSEIKRYVYITFFLAVYSFGLVGFIVKSELVGGGVNGIGTLVYYLSGKVIDVGYTSFVINVLLLVLAWRIIGRQFAIKTVYAVFMSSFFINLASSVIKEPFMGDDLTMSALVGSIVIGFCLGMIFKLGGSTGGTDIVAMIINKYRNVTPGKIILYCDVLIIGSSLFVFTYFMGHSILHAFRIVVYGFVTMAITAYAIDLVLLGAQQSVQMFVFSRKHEIIADYITQNLHRGVTIIDGQGWYTKQDSKIVLVVIYKREMQLLLLAIKSLDPEAFTSIGNVTGVYGKGFAQIKK